MAERVFVRVVPTSSSLVGRAKQLVQDEAFLSWVMLFEGDRWTRVEYAAGDPVGLASLAPTDEEGRGGRTSLASGSIPLSGAGELACGSCER